MPKVYTSIKHTLTFHLLHGLLLIYPLLYFMSQNSAEYMPTTYLSTICIVLFYYITISLIHFILNRYVSTTAFFIFYGLYLIGFSLVLSCTLSSSWYLSFIISLIVVISSIIIHQKTYCLPIITLLFLMSSISIYQYININSYKRHYLFEAISLKQKPNIYLLILESYHGNEALKKLYSFDNQNFCTYLEQNNFVIYPNFYATRHSTRLSLINLVTGNNFKRETETPIKKYLEGYYPNLAITTLLKNGYRLKYKFPNDYIYPVSQKQEASTYNWKLIFKNSLFYRATNLKPRKYTNHNDFIKDVIHTINTINLSESPYFFMTKLGGITEDTSTYQGGVAHIPNNLIRSNHIDILPSLRQNYINEIRQQNHQIKPLIRSIIDKDPNSIIILLGDHGAYFSKIFKDKNITENNDVTEEEYILDFFNVLAAIRWPKHIKTEAKPHFIPELFHVIFSSINGQRKYHSVDYILYDSFNKATYHTPYSKGE